MTTEITSLPQLTPEGLPLALARRAAEETRMTRAAAKLEAYGEAVTLRALAAMAHISLNTACTWLRKREMGESETAPMLSVMHYNSYSNVDNMPASENSTCTEVPTRASASVDPPAKPSAPDGETVLPTLPVVCPAASHRLLWRWAAGAWNCPVCADLTLERALLSPWGG